MKPSRDIPDELLGVAETLENNRPQLHGLEADRIKRRAMAQASTTATRTSTKGLFMRSRLAITSLLALGLLMTGSGAALGVTALNSSTGSAAQAQYGNVVVDDNGDVLGTTEEGGGVPGGGVPGDEGAGEGSVLGFTATGGEAPEAVAQGSRQLAAGEGGGQGDGQGGSSLPFTGFAAIPVLLIGTVLLAAGLVLRRDVGRSAAQS